MIPGLPALFPSGNDRQLEEFLMSPAHASEEEGLSAEEAWVQHELGHYATHYTKPASILVSATTFNVACRKPTMSLAGLVALTSPNGERPVDVVLVGLQEVDMSATAMLKVETEAMSLWVQALGSVVPSDTLASAMMGSGSAPYVALPPKQMVGLLLCVYVRRGLLPHVREHGAVSVATGTLGTMGNKGAVGIRLVVHRTPLCLMTAHLAAGQDNVSHRNQDIHRVFQVMDFNTARQPIFPGTSEVGGHASIIPCGILSQSLLPRDHDVVIVAGDLNYRVEMNYKQAVDCANRGDVSRLLEHDQFTAELAHPHTPWKNFKDLTPRFPPTYRFDIGTSTYDTSAKRRVPSFTDRVCVWLKHASSEAMMKVESLRSVAEVTFSDHRPVQAILQVPIAVEDPPKKAEVLASLRARIREVGLDRVSSTKTAVDVTTLDFGVLQYYASGTGRSITVSNRGQCVAHVCVLRQRQHPVGTTGEDESQSAWLRVSPTHFSILPQESVSLMVEAVIDPRYMPWMRRWRPLQGQAYMPLTCCILLGVQGGSMHVVECSCVLQPSVFGNSLENISLLDRLSCQVAYDTCDDISTAQQRIRPQVPRVLWFMADRMMRDGLHVPQLFTASVSADTCTAIMRHLDTTVEPIPDTLDVRCVASCLLTFLANLQVPVIPFSLYSAALAAARAKGRAPRVFVQQQLPALHANVWVYVMALLNCLLRPQNAQYNGLTVALVAKLFSEAMIPRPSNPLPDGRSTHPSNGGVMDQQVRQLLQQEREDAMALVQYFLTPPPASLQL